MRAGSVLSAAALAAVLATACSGGDDVASTTITTSATTASSFDPSPACVDEDETLWSHSDLGQGDWAWFPDDLAEALAPTQPDGRARPALVAVAGHLDRIEPVMAIDTSVDPFEVTPWAWGEPNPQGLRRYARLVLVVDEVVAGSEVPEATDDLRAGAEIGIRVGPGTGQFALEDCIAGVGEVLGLLYRPAEEELERYERRDPTVRDRFGIDDLWLSHFAFERRDDGRAVQVRGPSISPGVPSDLQWDDLLAEVAAAL